MKRVQELATENSKPIWQHFTKNKPAKTKVLRNIQKRKHAKMKIMLNDPLTNKCVHTRHKEQINKPMVMLDCEDSVL